MVSPEELDAFEVDKGLDAFDNVFIVDADYETDWGQTVWETFVSSNPMWEYSYGIPMVYRRNMTIGIISGTYEWDSYPLSNINEYLNE